MANYTLVCPFLNESPDFAHGVEFGLFYVRMRDSDEPIADYFSRANQDQILLAANRLGWTVKTIKPHDKFWFWCEMEKS